MLGLWSGLRGLKYTIKMLKKNNNLPALYKFKFIK